MMKIWTTVLLILTVCYTQAQAPKLDVQKIEYLFEEGKFFKQCHASSIAETSCSDLIAAWFGGTHEGNKDVVIWSSLNQNGIWSIPTEIANGKMDNGDTYPCWNPVLFRPKDSDLLYLYYKVGPNPRAWWGMVKTSDNNGKSWSIAKRLPDGILGPIKNKPIELANGQIISPSSIEVSEHRWIAHVEKSVDKQHSWRYIPIDTLSGYNVIQPSIISHNDGRLQVLCRSKEGKVMYSFSSDQGETWSKLAPTTLLNPNSATDVIAWKNGFLIVYNPALPGKDWWEGRSKLRIAFSTDGVIWKDLLILEDQEKGEFSYPTILLDSKDQIHITYTYDRKNIKHYILN